MTDYEALRSAYDIYMIKNVMGRHAYLHACNRHDIEMEDVPDLFHDSRDAACVIEDLCRPFACGTDIE